VPPEQHVLEGAAQSARGDLVGRKSEEALALQSNLALGGAVDAGNQIEDSGLAGPVRADQTAHLPGRNFEIVVVNSPQPAEEMGHVLDIQQCSHNLDFQL
jgi:hypothetical protein